jgi:phenylpyruvate tautomerase PptA (4-oxalocrotonate tautomerase family)
VPQFELHMTAGALSEPAKAELMDGLTRLLLKMEGAPDTPSALDITWGTVREYAPEDWTVGSRPAPGPRYRNGFWGGYGVMTDVMDIATYVDAPMVAGRPTEKGLRMRRSFEKSAATGSPAGGR